MKGIVLVIKLTQNSVFRNLKQLFYDFKESMQKSSDLPLS